MTVKRAAGGFLLALLAVVFSIGLAFASLELPSIVHGVMVDRAPVLSGDPLADDAGRQRVELFLRHYHLRTIGYACFGLMVGLIALGFALGRTGLAAAGAALLFLPVFAQFAAVMFFLAGLGLLNLVWLPMLDLSFDSGRLGDIVYLPYWVLSWVLGKLGFDAHACLVVGLVGGGLLVFIAGTWTWFAARSSGHHVARSWVYRFSRHPQYLGWIVWSYGMLLALMSVNYPKRSWGIAASLPWLLSAMVIIGVALLEEGRMARRFPAEYRSYRERAPFLLPLPRWLAEAFTVPSRLMLGKRLPDRGGEIAVVLGLFAAVMMGLSFVTVRVRETPTVSKTVRRAVPEGATRAELYIEALRQGETWHERRPYVAGLRRQGQAAVGPLIELLDDPSPALREIAARLLGESGSPEAVQPLVRHLSEAEGSVRFWIVSALGELRTEEALPPLLAELAEANDSSADAAVTALGSIGSEVAVDLLVERLTVTRGWARANVVNALGKIGSQRAARPLVDLWNSGPDDVEVRRALVVALGRLRGPTTAGALREARDDSDLEVRIYAAEALRSIGR